MISGIYHIYNFYTNKIYIGSAINFNKRFTNHKNKLISNKHPNKNLQSDWNTYGEGAFKFKIIELVEDKTKLFEKEKYHIDLNKEKLYNIQMFPGHSNMGRKFSEEHKRKMSNILKGRIFSDETKAKISAAKLGKKRIISKSHRENLSKAMKGNKNLLGFKFNAESKAKISKFLIGNKRALKYAEAELVGGIVMKVS